jgi:hypothetical protein
MTMTEIEKIEGQLDELLTALVAHRRAKETKGGPATFKLIRLDMNTPLPQPPGSPADFANADDIVDKALRYAIRRLGEQVARITNSTQAMLDVCEKASARSPKHKGYRVSVIDYAWDCIKAGDDIWAA